MTLGPQQACIEDRVAKFVEGVARFTSRVPTHVVLFREDFDLVRRRRMRVRVAERFHEVLLKSGPSREEYA